MVNKNLFLIFAFAFAFMLFFAMSFVSAIAVDFDSSTIINNSQLTFGINNSAYVSVNNSITGDHYFLNNFDNSLVGWWRGEGNANDEMGMNNGTLAGEANASSVGKFGSAFSFDGTGDYVNLTSPNNIPTGDSPESFFVWIKSTTANDGAVFSQGTGSNGELRAILKLENSGFYFGGFGDEHECDHRSDMTAELLDGNWHQIGFVYRGEGNLSLYADSIEYTCSIFSPLSTSSAEAYLGSSTLSWENPLNGQLDDAILFNRSLSDQEIKALYNATANRYNGGDSSLLGWWEGEGNAKDELGINNGTWNGDISYSAGKFGQAFVFNGSEYITTGLDSNFLSQNYSVSFWIRTVVGTGSATAYSTSSELESPTGYDLTFQPEMQISNGTDWCRQSSGSNPVIYDGSWYYVTVLKNEDIFTLYVDGEATTRTISCPISPATNNNFTLAHGFNTGWSHNGVIDDFMVFNKTLSSEEILTLYHQYDGKYYNNFTDLSVGNHSFQAFAVNSSGIKSETEERGITVLEGVTLLEGCGELSSGTYYLGDDLEITGNLYDSCFKIDADNILIDCQGHTINDEDYNYGLFSYVYSWPVTYRNNFSIKNCNIFSGNMGFYLNYLSNVSIENVNFTNDEDGSSIIRFYNTEAELRNVNFSRSYSDIDNDPFEVGSSNVSVYDSYLYLQSESIYAENSNLTLNNVDIYSNRNLIMTNTYFNLTDVNITSYENNGIKLGGDSVDTCNSVMDRVFINNLNVSYFTEAVSLDNGDFGQLILCNASDSTISNSNVSLGVHLYFTNETEITNLNITDTKWGLYLSRSHQNLIQDNDLIDTEVGFYLEYADNNIIDQNIVNLSSSNIGGGESCPFLYTWNGTSYTFVSDMSTEGKLSWKTRYPDDYLKIDGNQLQPQDGKYNLQVTEEYDEISFIDQLKLITLDHSPEVDVFNGLTRVDSHTIYTVSKNPDSVQSCTDSLGNDCLSAVSEKDGMFTMHPVDNVTNMVTLNLGNLSNASDIKLIISYAWANGYLVSNQSKSVQVKDESGNWVSILSNSDLTARAALQKTYVLNLTNRFLTEDYSVRFLLPIHAIDYVAVDTTSQQEVIVKEYDPLTADLHYRGYSRYTTNITRVFFYNDLISQGFSTPSGNFTRYGDVLPLVNSTDDIYSIVGHGDEISASFEYEPIPEGQDRDFLMFEYAYYKTASLDIGKEVGPLPFAAMSSYPYPENESYPSDEEHLNYLSEYNTRQYVSDKQGMSLPSSFNNTVSNNVLIGSGDSGTNGLYLQNEINTSLINNTIYDFEYGIYLSSSERTSIENNTIFDVEYGVYTENSEGTEIIENNITATYEGYGIYLYQENYDNNEYTSYVSNNHISSDYLGIYLYETYYSNLAGNDLGSSSGQGVLLEYGEENNFENNTLTMLDGKGITVGSECYNNNFTNNTINSTDDAIYISGGYDNLFLHNTLISDFWIEDDGDGANRYNDSYSGNIYYFSDGTPSGEIYDITDSNDDGWADSGSDLPFNSSLLGRGDNSNEIKWGVDYLYGIGNWVDSNAVFDNDTATGSNSSDARAHLQSGFANLNGGRVISALFVVYSGLGISEFELPSECLLDVPVTQVYSYPVDGGNYMNITCQTTEGPYVQMDIIEGTSQLNEVKMSITYAPVSPWRDYGQDYHPYTEKESAGSGNQEDTTHTTPSGGYSQQTYFTDGIFPTEGNNFNLRYNDKIKFSVNFTNHTLTMQKFNSTIAKALIQSSPITVYLQKGVLYEFDLNNDSVADVRVRYDGLNATKAMMFIREIISANEEESLIAGEVVENNERNLIWLWTILVVVFIILIYIVLKQKSAHLKSSFRKPQKYKFLMTPKILDFLREAKLR